MASAGAAPMTDRAAGPLRVKRRKMNMAMLRLARQLLIGVAAVWLFPGWIAAFDTALADMPGGSRDDIPAAERSARERAEDLARDASKAFDRIMGDREMPAAEDRRPALASETRSRTHRDIESGSDWLSRVRRDYRALIERLSEPTVPNPVVDAAQRQKAERDALWRRTAGGGARTTVIDGVGSDGTADARQRPRQRVEAGKPEEAAEKVVTGEDGSILAWLNRTYRRYQRDVIGALARTGPQPTVERETPREGPPSVSRDAAIALPDASPATAPEAGAVASDPARVVGADSAVGSARQEQEKRREDVRRMEMARKAEVERKREQMRLAEAAEAERKADADRKAAEAAKAAAARVAEAERKAEMDRKAAEAAKAAVAVRAAEAERKAEADRKAAEAAKAAAAARAAEAEKKAEVDRQAAEAATAAEDAKTAERKAEAERRAEARRKASEEAKALREARASQRKADAERTAAAAAERDAEARRTARARVAEDVRRAKEAREQVAAEKVRVEADLTAAEAAGDAAGSDRRQAAKLRRERMIARRHVSAARVAEQQSLKDVTRAETAAKAAEAAYALAESSGSSAERRRQLRRASAEVRKTSAAARRVVAAAERLKVMSQPSLPAVMQTPQSVAGAADVGSVGNNGRQGATEAKPDCEGAGQSITPPGWYVVARGDSLWRIARAHYSAGKFYRRIYRANTRRLDSPRDLRPCQRVYLPRL